MTTPTNQQAPNNQGRAYHPVTVPFAATPTGEPPDIRQWAHRTVWSERMLTTLLEDKVKGGKWHTLIDKVWSDLNLYTSAHRVLGKKGAPGVDGQTTTDFAEHEQAELRRLQEQLKQGTYRPAPVKRTWIDKPGSQDKRPLGIPTVRDRIVQKALVHVIEPIFDATFHERSFGFRHGRGCHDALRCVETLLNEGYVYVVDADLKGYFDSIPKDRLQEMIRQKISDRRVLELIKQFLHQGILEELRTWVPEAGVPQGAVLSPVLSNVYLNPLDHEMARRGFQMVRYADDFVILCRTQEEAEAALSAVRQWVTDYGLTLHPEKTHIVDSRAQSFAFLGYSFRGTFRFPRAKSHQKFMDRIRELTPRKSGESLECILQRLNQATQGWFHYFRHCHWTIFGNYDGRIRSRLRRLLLKRHRRNPEHLPRNRRWPNAFFADRGYLSLKTAHVRFGQSTGTY